MGNLGNSIGHRETSQLVMQELSDLWKTTSPDAANISGDISPKKFAAAPPSLKTRL